MPTLGMNDLKQYAIPANWDASYLRNLSLEDGTTYDTLVSAIAAALFLQNNDLKTHPLYAGLISSQPEPTIEYRTGGAPVFEAHSERTRANAQRTSVNGHMLPLLPYDYAMEWTWDFLRKARRSQVDADIKAGMEALRNIYQQKILTRLFKSTYDSVGSGKSMPLADGGTADSTYVPIAVPDRGGTFTSSHNHFKFLNGITQANVQTVVDTLWEHNIDGPYEMLIAQADVSNWSNTSNVTGWVNKVFGEIQYGNNTTLALLDNTYVGAINTTKGTLKVRASGRIPANYYAIYRSYGNMDERNPLVVRESNQYGMGAVLLAGDHIRQFPLESAIMFTEFGVGVKDRISAVAAYNTAGGSYTDPTIV